MTQQKGRLIRLTYADAWTENLKAQQLQDIEVMRGFKIPLEAVVDCKGVLDALKSEDVKLPTETTLILLLYSLKEMLTSRILERLWWLQTTDRLTDGLNKGAVSRRAIVEAFIKGVWKTMHECKPHSEPDRVDQ